VDYWSADGSGADALDAVTWGVKNPDTVAKATGSGIKKSADELGNAIVKDSKALFMGVAKVFALGGIVLLGFKYLGSYSSAKGAKDGK